MRYTRFPRRKRVWFPLVASFSFRLGTATGLCYRQESDSCTLLPSECLNFGFIDSAGAGRIPVQTRIAVAASRSFYSKPLQGLSYRLLRRTKYPDIFDCILKSSERTVSLLRP